MRTRARVSERMKNPGTVKIYLRLGITRSLQSLSIRPLSGRKKKKNERCRIHERIRVVILVNHENDEESNARKLGPCNWKSDWRFSFSSFLRLHSFCHSFSSLLTRILTSKENFISRFKRNIRNLYIHEQAN